MIDFKIAPDGGEPFEVTATTRDIRQWERVNKGASLKKLTEELRMADLYSVAHFACRRKQLYTGTLAEFEEYHDLEFEMDGDEDPTPPAH